MNRRTKIKFKDFECNLLVNGMNEFRNMLVVISIVHSYCTPLKTKHDIILKENTDIQVNLVCLDAV